MLLAVVVLAPRVDTVASVATPSAAATDSSSVVFAVVAVVSTGKERDWIVVADLNERNQDCTKSSWMKKTSYEVDGGWSSSGRQNLIEAVAVVDIVVADVAAVKFFQATCHDCYGTAGSYFAAAASTCWWYSRCLWWSSDKERPCR